MKLAFFDTKSYDIPSFEKYGERNDLEIKFFETGLDEDTVSLAQGYDAVCAFVNDTLNAAVVDKLCEYGVKAIFMRCAGYNNVDLEACKGRLPVYRVPAYSPYAVAEHAMALLLAINRRTHKAYIRTRDFNFSLQGFVGFDLHGKTVGIIGTGKIGQVFADICKGFGMKILAYDKYPNPKTGLEYTTLDDLFTRSDIISLHCPLTEETYHIVDEQSINRMKKGVTIINTSRGPLIDTRALIYGLKDKKVGAACLDVYEEEGDLFYEDFSAHIVQDDNLVRLIGMPNVIVSSHQAFLTQEALDNIASTTVDNLVRFFSGNPNSATEVTLPA